MKKIFLQTFLVVLLVLEFPLNVYANQDFSENDCVSKVAYIDNVNIDGSNINNDIVNRDSILLDSEHDLSVSFDNNDLYIQGKVRDIEFSAHGIYQTSNETSNILLYQNSKENKKNDVLYMSIERKLDETPLFFYGFHKSNPKYKNVIKLYMKPMNTNDLIVIEIFLKNDYVFEYTENYKPVFNREESNRLLAWFVNCYNPIKRSDEMNLKSLKKKQVEVIDLSETYNIYGNSVTFVFKIELKYFTPSICKYGSGTGVYNYKVKESYTTSTSPSYCSETQEYLRLKNLNIKVASIPNVVFSTQSPLRKSIQNNWGNISTDFSVSFGFTCGLISASGSLNFDESKYMDTDKYSFSTNGGKGVKGTESGILPSSYYLQKLDSIYGFDLVYNDLVGEEKSEDVKIKFDYYVKNMYDYTKSYSGSYSDSVTLDIY